MRLGAGPVTLAQFGAAVAQATKIEVAAGVAERLAADRRTVDAAVAGTRPVYGLNTGLGSNLGHRLAEAEIVAFQRQLIEGRAVSTGGPLPENVGRGVILARLITAAGGGSGISGPMYDHLCAVYRAGLSPMVPEYGSIGAGDLTQVAVVMLAVLGQGQMWRGGVLCDAGEALASEGLNVPPLLAKDGMALINHGGVSVTLAAGALVKTGNALAMTRAAALLAYAGYDADRGVLAEEVNALRPSPGQADVARWLRERLTGMTHAPRRVQEALSFRVIGSVLGAALTAQAQAEAIWQDEANGLSDSPVVLGEDAMRSTANFHAPALALALEGCALANAMVANGAAQRIQRMMNPDLSGLPRYLSPVGGASAGMVPLQKTVAAILGDIRRHAMPVTLDPAPVSETVEDMAPMTPLAARKLSAQGDSLALLAGAEALVAGQALDLRAPTDWSAPVATLHKALRAKVDRLDADRPLGGDIQRAEAVLAGVAPTL